MKGQKLSLKCGLLASDDKLDFVSNSETSSRDRVGQVLKPFAAVLSRRDYSVDDRFVVRGNLDFQTSAVILELFHRPRSHDDRRNNRVGETPSQGELRGTDTLRLTM